MYRPIQNVKSCERHIPHWITARRDSKDRSLHFIEANAWEVLQLHRYTKIVISFLSDEEWKKKKDF